MKKTPFDQLLGRTKRKGQTFPPFSAQSVKTRVAEILANSDPESAHAAEDDLLSEFVHHVAEGQAGRPIAKEIVKLLNATRVRWFA